MRSTHAKITTISAILIACLGYIATAYSQPKPLRIGIIVDGPWERNAEILKLFQTEIQAVLGSDYTVEYPPTAQRVADWDPEQINAHINDVLADPSIDLVLAMGVLSSNDVCRRGPLAKPTLAPFVIDPVVQGIPVHGDSSGVHNLSYITWPHRVANDLAIFHEIVPFRHLAMMTTRSIEQAAPGIGVRSEQIVETLGARFTLIPVDTSLNDAIAAIPADADAVYLAPLLRLPEGAIQELANGLIQRKLPSFSMLGEREVELGILAGLGQQSNFDRIARRTALQIQRIMAGDDPASFSTILRRDEHLTINMATARAISVWPPWALLTEANLINDVREAADCHLTLSTAIDSARAHNPDLAAAEHSVSAGAQQVVRARARLLPQIDASVLGTIIDEDRASASLGSVAERELSGSIEAEQVVFAEGAWADLAVQRRLQEARVAEFDRIRLDIAQQTASAYLALLRARTLEKIERDNLRLTRSHLQLAQTRLAVGTAGQAEVYRWESELASGQKRAIEANSQRNLAEMALNRLLHRPSEAPFTISETGLDDPSLPTADARFRRYVDDPGAFRLFRQILSDAASEQAPEIHQIDATLSAQKRILASRKRAFFLPTVGLSAGATRLFDEAGAGSDFELPFPELGPGADNTDWFVGLQISLPLFHGGSRIADVSEARATLSQLERERGSVVQRIDQRVRSATHSFGASYAGIQLSREAAEAARKNLELVSDAYARGAVSILDLLDAQNAALVADQVAADAVYNCLSDWIEVERATGRMSHLSSPAERTEWLQSVDQRFRDAGLD